MPREPFPRVQSGLPRAIERQLMRRYARTTAGRMTLAAALRALAVLVGRHPRAALDMAGSGLVQAGRVGVQDLTQRLGRYERRTSPPAEVGRRAPLTARERRRFRRLLDAQAQRRRQDSDAPA